MTKSLDNRVKEFDGKASYKGIGEIMLTGIEIIKQLGKGIIIEPYCKEQLNPNSYNLRITDELATYKEGILDLRRKNETQLIKIPEEGLILKPRELYLAKTYEYTETKGFIPVIFGRSSVGRLGLTVHISAGFGDIGFKGNWTLQLTCVKPIKIYPFMPLCQIAFFETTGDNEMRYKSKYQNSNGIESSRFYEEL